MTGYIRGNLTEPDGAEELLATAEQSIAVAARLDIPRLNLDGTGLGEGGIPVKPVEILTGEMWLATAAAL
jgi:hydroxypyruvate isomerase